MPVVLLRFLPYIAAFLAVLAGVAYIDHRGYARAQADQAALEQRLGAKITDAVASIDTQTAARIGAIHRTESTVIQPVITKELASAAR